MCRHALLAIQSGHSSGLVTHIGIPICGAHSSSASLAYYSVLLIKVIITLVFCCYRFLFIPVL